MPEEISQYLFICFKSFFLGVIQGFTEFLPISSTAHLKVVPYLFGWNDLGVSFSASIQLGSALAIIYYFRNQISSIIKSFLSTFNPSKGIKDENSRLFIYIFVASIPILVFGLLIKLYWPNYSDSNLRDLFSIAITSIVMALLLALAEFFGKRNKLFVDINLNDVIKLGLAQSLALFPGVSRSGITLTSALFSGIERKTAARLSFLVGIPAISISGLVELFSLIRVLSVVEIIPIIIGIISSFFSSIFSIDLFLKFLSKNNTLVFVYYRLAFGIFILTTL
ncbi:undecaprenyl-diphosphate phosphatase [Prochlorococcus sp. MIT 0801]|uniref:undecaprenyl-diphosphate phosphatase n=1 Tax=Prochlorococcus sp. MIT 0801 TaxID=1501269 RepID=UPI0004F667CC|nr:undecaprenyl-diphosphate phosphatase [Prochlorococcus sp. MIT 0801]AIQ97029.1 Undecaprenyl-diphosphatasee [Prochlorococcus sp. MIT 0801]